MAIPDSLVAGIDVGSTRKGFHAVALLNGRYLAHTACRDVEAVAAWCTSLRVTVVGVDAPCCWSRDGRARAAERELATSRISCFSTPTLERATSHPKDYYGWMLNGARLYTALQSHYSLFDGVVPVTKPTCFETFPHAIACELAAESIPRRQRVQRRRAILEAAGIDTSQLTNVDLRDAALCAFTADALLRKRIHTRGCVDDGFIVVPKLSRS